MRPGSLLPLWASAWTFCALRSRLMAHRIVIATGNPHKVSEIAAVLGPAAPGVEFVGLSDVGDTGPEPVEDGDSFVVNASIKARAYAQRTGELCLADDSGLIVDALNGAPGVYSARYAAADHPGGEEAFELLPRGERDGLNNAKLLAELAGVEPEGRGARFVCAMVLASPEGEELAAVNGLFEGRIGVPPAVPRGANGFGYDPLFLFAPDHALTSAELAPEAKNKISHRAKACLLIAERLASVL